ncbi:MAG: tRNA (N6-isopentenyl adenosine(37)-C2)-methylthiotransferase MiaB [Planctomycetes bacterium]|nr:tRNA (N6-isopentenyl adenosine(37)-C2)-methylthiotransferase MiaB [Planctomycetota bacterium]MBT6452110.1 tRNA (N6-isopentenyl adenosine(37)-C2)-methylthiotransferase MiaB [Planctomycetota bacterium]MBT6541550.1 tRNA (N6-isopentenyl adenosine(37)-C2)-methylthiotransferase MiaB [Planctomycetota bacterium]MBT6784623.1 tRNA (N6-isopentenyl adenosine(37)-C2)-methylthiotransferase MiaB [Planctomycetota bacterium]MBT6969144.1 tRNA (N6-isopentenyl adenosine(37)-C2)-methylthiotransferase MiaB [Planc
MKLTYPMKITPIAADVPRSHRVYFEVFGCQMNKLDAELMLEGLTNRGYHLVHDPEDAGVILYNTCSVREHAEERAVMRMTSFKRRKKREPDLILGLTGCVAQHKQDELTERAPWIDLIIGTREFDRLPELIEEARGQRNTVLATEMDSPLEFVRQRNLGPQPWHAFVSVMRGCDMVCTYCIVPTTRGKEVSRPPEMILDEVRRLADTGVKEITFLGQTVNSYGKRLGAGIGLDTLLRGVEEIDGIERCHFITSHPRFLRPKLIQAMAECTKVMDYLHLPVQSGSDSMLARMKRTYDRSFYLHVIDRLRDQIPDITLATDFIVGFPGETEDEFEESLSLIDEVGFDHGYVFQYSPRPGTVSDHQMDDDIPLEVKKQRNHRLLERISTSGEGRNQRFLGRQVEVIAEGTSRSNDSRWAGKARDHRTVIWDAQDDEVAGSFVVVEVDRASAATLYGQRVAGPSPRPILPNSSAL